MGHFPISRTTIAGAAIVAALLAAAWMGRYELVAPTTATNDGVATPFTFVLDRWTGSVSYCMPRICQEIEGR